MSNLLGEAFEAGEKQRLFVLAVHFLSLPSLMAMAGSCSALMVEFETTRKKKKKTNAETVLGGCLKGKFNVHFLPVNGGLSLNDCF